MNVGDVVPDIERVNQDGQPIKLSDYRGKKVILFAFPKANTPGCTTQACGFRDSFPQIKDANAVVLGISRDKPKELKAWKDAKNLPYDLISDPDHKLLEALGGWGERSMFGKAFSGTLRSHWVIDEEGKIMDEQLRISPKNSVLKAVKLLEV